MKLLWFKGTGEKSFSWRTPFVRILNLSRIKQAVFWVSRKVHWWADICLEIVGESQNLLFFLFLVGDDSQLQCLSTEKLFCSSQKITALRYIKILSEKCFLEVDIALRVQSVQSEQYNGFTCLVHTDWLSISTLHRKRCMHKGHITANTLQWRNKDVEKWVKETGWAGQGRNRSGWLFL